MLLYSRNQLLKHTLLLAPIIFLGGCASKPKSNGTNESTKNNAISGYSASVISLKLPFADSCDDTIAIQRLKLPDSLLKFNSYGQLIGKVKETDKYVAILYTIPSDVQLPVLHTFSKDGDQISSLKLFIGNCCGENEGCSGLSTFLITRDLRIILKDSMQTFIRDKKHADKKRNIKLESKQEYYKIDSTGRIIRYE